MADDPHAAGIIFAADAGDVAAEGCELASAACRPRTSWLSSANSSTNALPARIADFIGHALSLRWRRADDQGRQRADAALSRGAALAAASISAISSSS